MADELADKTIGERIQIIRERQGKSRPVLAGLVGRSGEWLKAVEKGRLHPPRWEKLVQLADALGVQNLAELTGDKPPMGATGRATHEAVPAMREAIEETMLSVSAERVPDSATLHQRTADAWHLWHTSPTPRASVGAVLPQIIREARHATRALDGDQRRQAHVALSAAYALSEQVLAWVADSALLWLAADRCMSAAEQADDPEALAGAAWVLGNVWRATGREEDALRLVTDAADLLAPHLNTSGDGTRALWGSCRLHAAITAARLGREGDALRHLDQANNMADRLPADYAHPWTLFGRANTDVTGVSVHVDLRKSGQAIDVAEQINPDQVPSVDRRARLWLEAARAYHQRREHTATLYVLQRATNVSEESMRCHPLSRGIAGELVTLGGRMVQPEARGLAHRLGLTV
ncbi:Helix-turn-helix domain-containing protein [Actinopolyspora lacussalsi subsp. righensis]|uniref:Helix-turn-helix domain-containing protein n=1 Tax=Actinopolyspora righensis TaxID=995060 RepID=A0A1I7ACH6_9ACTN|nr:helix-turn-helix transcriptional regulator [Actinopolyspora righensis]SFT72598.1 Helix-turn-helix domain-containing protein [Actinopolyspora righensis]